jgi:hypothetical protein
MQGALVHAGGAHDSIARVESGYPIAAYNDYAIWRAFDKPGRQDVRPSPCCSMASQSATRASIVREWSTSSLVHRCDGIVLTLSATDAGLRGASDIPLVRLFSRAG